MSKELEALEQKVNEFDIYCRMGFDPTKPETLYGETKEEQKKFAEYAKEIYDLTSKCSFKTEEQIELRNRALVQLQLIKVADDVRTTRLDNEPIPDAGATAEEKDAYDKKAKKRDEAMLRYNCSIAGIKGDEENLSKAIDLDQITWAQSTSIDQLQESLDSYAVDRIMNMGPDSEMYKIKSQAFGKGGLSAYTYLIPDTNGKGYKLDKSKTGEKMLTDILKDSKMKAMISSYKKAEKSWLMSAMTPTQEIENRLRFVNAYENELKTLFFVMNSQGAQDPALKEVASKVFSDKGISELMKDYKTFYEPDNKKTDFIMDGANEYDLKFRKEYKQVKDNLENPLPKDKKLGEFHKFLLDHGDYGTGVKGDVSKTEKQVRPFIDNFMSLPEKDQLKALYMLENKMYKTNEKVTDEMLKDYVPDVKKATKVMKASNLKFWKRMDSSYIYWNKLKTCVDKVYDQAQPVPEKKKSDKVKKAATKVIKVGSLATKALSTAAPSIALSTAGAVIGSVEGIKNIAKDKEVTTGTQKASEGLGVAAQFTKSSQLTAMGAMLQTGNMVYMKAFQGLAVATNTLLTVKSVTDLVSSKKNVNRVAELGEEINNMMQNKSLVESMTPEQKGILEKLETNTRMLKVINRDKVKIATAETVKNSTSLACSTMMATGVGVAALIPQAVVGIGTKIAEKKIRSQNTKDVVDAKLYKNPEEKKKKIDQTKATIVGRYVRLPKKMQQKYETQVGEMVYSDDKLAGQARQEAVRKSGQVNLQATKQSYIGEIGKDIYDLLKTGAKKVKDGPLTALDEKFVDLANKFIKATGGKKVDITKMDLDSPKAQAAEKTTIKNMTKNMTL